MSYESELYIFMRELGKLIDEYYKCECPVIKEQIYTDIKLLSDALSLCDRAH
ncbi:hypothetical protein QY96_00612 [Bacillus thermotolerans]|nr:hypothetical protein QY96_00612 [Bacillus thermotolerans]